METTQVIYTRHFTDFGRLQNAYMLQYLLTEDPQKTAPYGVAIAALCREAQTVRSCPALFQSREEACRILTFLWENAVGPQTMPALLADLRQAGLLFCGKEEK